jgi:hypothetical protein
MTSEMEPVEILSLQVSPNSVDFPAASQVIFGHA